MGRIWHVLGVQKVHLSGSCLQGLPRPGAQGVGETRREGRRPRTVPGRRVLLLGSEGPEGFGRVRPP